MGEYADDGIDRDYGNFCDYKTGTGIYGEDSEIYAHSAVKPMHFSRGI